MGVARFTEVPASLEEVGGGVLARVAQWGTLLASALLELAPDQRQVDHDHEEWSELGDRLDAAVWTALSPRGAPALLLALSLAVGLLRYACITAGAIKMVSASLGAIGGDADGKAKED